MFCCVSLYINNYKQKTKYEPINQNIYIYVYIISTIMKQSFPILSRSDEPIIINHYEPLWLALWTITIMNQSSITGWWFESLWTTLVNGKDDIPYIMENIKCSKPPTSDIWLIIDCLIILIVTWEFASHYEPINQIMNIEKLIVSRWHPLWLWTNQPDYEPPTSDIWLIIDCLIILIVTREFSSHYEPINQIMNIEKLIVSPWHPLWLWTNQPDYEPPTSDIWLIIDCLIILIVTWEFASHYETDQPDYEHREVDSFPMTSVMIMNQSTRLWTTNQWYMVDHWLPNYLNCYVEIFIPLWANQPDYEHREVDSFPMTSVMIMNQSTRLWTTNQWYMVDHWLPNYLNCYVGNFIPLWTNQPDYETQHFEPINHYDYEPFWFSSLPANNFRLLQRQEFHRRANLIHEVGRHPSGKKRWKLLGEKHDFIPLLNHKTWEKLSENQ